MSRIPPPTTERAAFGTSRPVVYLLDSDATAQRSMAQIIESRGMRAIQFDSASAYLAHTRTDATACLIVDPKLPDIHGLDLQQQLSGGRGPPMIFVSGCHDIRCTVLAVKGGAIEFLPKPLDADALLAAIDLALAEDVRTRERHARSATLRWRYDLLTARERQVLPLIVSGLRNKQAASILGIAEVTLQAHRGQIMRKMAARSFADLVRMAGLLNIPWFVNRSQQYSSRLSSCDSHVPISRAFDLDAR
jgi:FixJ family two-component response regulator